MSSNGSSLKQPVWCVEASCQLYQVKHYGGQKICRICGGEMFPVVDEKKPPALFDFPGQTVDQLRKLPVVVKHDDTFRCSPDLRGCPIAQKPTVYIPLALYNKWIFLAEQVETEWIAYLTGKKREGKEDEYEIEDMYFPLQEATGSHVDAKDGEIVREDTIAAVHSHVGMNVFFSKEDEDHFNHTIELVVNNKGEIMAVGRTKLECGRWHRGPADIRFIECEDELALEDELRSKLTKKTYSTTFYSKKDDDRKTDNDVDQRTLYENFYGM